MFGQMLLARSVTFSISAVCPSGLWQTETMKMLILLFALGQLISVSYAGTERINPFTSDGCSSWPEGPRSNPNLWRECCYVHDLSYWMGGPKVERLAADKELRTCVKSKGADVNSFLMFVGVRLGGSPYRNTSYRWGYGWPSIRGYKVLTSSERENVIEELDLLSPSTIEESWIDSFRLAHKI